MSTGSLRMGTAAGRWVLTTTVLGSGMVMIDATVVNVALDRIGTDFDADFAELQWTVNAYALTLAAFILLGGSLGDHFGRRRVFVVGVVWFALASLLCGLAPDIGTLVAARALQGVGGALLIPGSLALISASFSGPDRAAAVGAPGAVRLPAVQRRQRGDPVRVRRTGGGLRAAGPAPAAGRRARPTG